jgi:hypothetical protein
LSITAVSVSSIAQARALLAVLGEQEDRAADDAWEQANEHQAVQQGADGAQASGLILEWHEGGRLYYFSATRIIAAILGVAYLS